MRKELRFMLMPVLACGLAVAQSSMSSDTDKDKHDHMNGKTKTMTGCVQEKDGKYWLMDKKHPNGVELMSSEDMKAHVGHKVSVTGTMSKMDMDKDGAMSGDSSMSKEDHEKMEKAEKKEKHEKHEHDGMRMMNVSSMQMVSDTCHMK
jgi:hypothetical protein